MDKIIRPDVVTVLWPQPYAGSVVQPETSFLRLFHWHFQPLTPPQAFNALVIDLPAGISQHLSTMRRSDDTHIDHTAGPVRSCPPQGGLHLRGPVVAVVAWIGAV